jgi:predicted metal-dependent hydrolase
MIPIGHGALPDYVSVERKAVKHLRLVINRDASVRLVLPKRASMRSALAFYGERQAWVDSKRRLVLAQQQAADAYDDLDSALFYGESYQVVYNSPCDAIDHSSQMITVRAPRSAAARLRVWRNLAALDLRQRLESEAVRLAVTVNKVSIRDQKSRWGSCSSKGNISLNWRVALMPLDVGNYIIAHEFAHLRHMNHSPRFWAEVERLCPKYRAAEHWIKQQGSALMMVQRR